MRPDSDDESWLHGYALSGEGGIPHDSPTRVGPLAKMNFLVGRNNHGKSTLLRAAADWTERRSDANTTGRRETLVPVERTAIDSLLRMANVSSRAERDQRVASALEAIDDGRVGVWAELSSQSNTNAQVDPQQVLRSLKTCLSLGNYSLTSVSSAPHVARQTVLIPAFRELRTSPAGTGEADRLKLASGEGLVAELDTWQHPKNPGSAAYDAAKTRWHGLQSFMRDVLEDDHAELEVAGGTDLHIRLAQAGRMLHIDNLGDGIKQVLMLAAAGIFFDDHLVLLEEPEIHLHAGLQRKLVRFLAEHTRSQYIIATHSAHVLAVENARIFHVVHDGTCPRITSTVRAQDVHRVCGDLGYMASDLMQANYTIWVEGPSDRLYWRRWLNLVDDELEEGVHYSVMTYGGYLVDGVALRDEEEAQNDLIQLLRLGRACTLIADSDKASPDAPLRPTVLRLQEESSTSGTGELIVCEWVSTVENLVPRELLRETLLELYPRAAIQLKRPENHTPYDKPFDGMRASTVSKVKVAQRVVDRLGPRDMGTELTDAATQLARRIRAANGLAASSA